MKNSRLFSLLAGLTAAFGIGGGFASEMPQREMGLLPEPQGTLLGWESGGEMIQLPPQGELVVEKVRPADCRVVMGFSHAPIDGRVDSWGYNGVVNEYNDSLGYVIGQWMNSPLYEYVADPILRVKLADTNGFNFMMIRGGFIGTVYRDADAPSGPGHGKLLAQLEEVNMSQGPRGVPHYKFWRINFPELVKTDSVGFQRRLNLLTDVTFLRLGAAAVARKYSGAIDYTIGEPVEDLAALAPDFIRLRTENPGEQHPSNFERRFFRKSDRAVYLLKSDGEGRAIDLKGEVISDQSQQAHLLTPPLSKGTAIGAVRVDLELKGPNEDNYIMITVQDPLIGNQELIHFDARVGKAARIRVLLDFSDQIMAEGRRFWITVSSRQDGRLMPGSKISLLTVPADAARVEFLADRLLLLKGYFSILSEARPWANAKESFSVKWLREYDGKSWDLQKLRPQLLDLYTTLEHLHDLAPVDPIITGQYYRWLVRDPRKPAEQVELPALPAIPGVPRWAQLMDRAARQIAEIPEWWVRHRMAPNGELGGAYSDDTDMIGYWLPSILIDSEIFAPVARDCMRRVAAGVLKYNLRDGVSVRGTDPLHAYEEGQNIMSHMPLAFYGNPQYVEWLMTSIRTCDKWLLRTPDGTYKWRVSDFGWRTAQDPPRELPAKVSSNADLMFHPHLILAWYNHNPQIIERIAAYSIGMPDTGAGRAFGGGANIHMAAYWFTGDPKHLKLPKRTEKGDYGDIWQWFKRQPDVYIFNSKEVCAQPWWTNYVSMSEANTSCGHWAWALKPRRDILEKSLENSLYAGPEQAGTERFRYIWTEAEIYTDRVFLPVQPVAQPMLGGYTVRNKLWPSYALSYEGLSKDFAALVLDQGKDRLKVAMINLAEKARAGAFLVWQLDHGKYELSIGTDANDDGQMDSIENKQTLELARMDRVPVRLAPRKLMIYELKQIEKLDDLYARADLAISEEDVAVAGNEVKVTIHNIGSAPVTKFDVSLVDAEGKPLETVAAERLDAPLDLMPRTLVVTLPLKPGVVAVVLDQQKKIPEITRLNNTVRIVR